MANKKNKNKSAEEVSKEIVQQKGGIPKDETIEDTQKWVAEQRNRLDKKEAELEERAMKFEGSMRGLQDKANKLNIKEADLNKWAKELAEKAKKGKGKTSKEDATHAKKLSNCFLHGTVEEYIRTSAESFEGEARHNFLNAIVEAGQAVKANT